MITSTIHTIPGSNYLHVTDEISSSGPGPYDKTKPMLETRRLPYTKQELRESTNHELLHRIVHQIEATWKRDGVTDAFVIAGNIDLSDSEGTSS